jgi:hypothetical protein
LHGGCRVAEERRVAEQDLRFVAGPEHERRNRARTVEQGHHAQARQQVSETHAVAPRAERSGEQLGGGAEVDLLETQAERLGDLLGVADALGRAGGAGQGERQHALVPDRCRRQRCRDGRVNSPRQPDHIAGESGRAQLLRDELLERLGEQAGSNLRQLKHRPAPARRARGRSAPRMESG